MTNFSNAVLQEALKAKAGLSLLLSEHVIEDDFVKSNGDMAKSDVEMMGNVLERYVNKINLLVEANKKLSEELADKKSVGNTIPYLFGKQIQEIWDILTNHEKLKQYKKNKQASYEQLQEQLQKTEQEKRAVDERLKIAYNALKSINNASWGNGLICSNCKCMVHLAMQRINEEKENANEKTESCN